MFYFKLNLNKVNIIHLKSVEMRSLGSITAYEVLSALEFGCSVTLLSLKGVSEG